MGLEVCVRDQGGSCRLQIALCFTGEEAFCDNKKTPQLIKHRKVLRDYSQGPGGD